MKSSIRGVILGVAGLALSGLAGCEDNEANVKGTGVTPPGAAATSEDGGKIKPPEKKAPIPSGYPTPGGGYRRSSQLPPARKS